MDELIQWVYGELERNADGSRSDTLDFYASRCIITPTNEGARAVNERIIDRFEPAEAVVVYSADSLLQDDEESNYPLEFLHSIHSASLPPHELRLHVGSILMVIRNYAPHRGVCNGTRVMVLSIGSKLLTVAVLTGPKRGDTLLLPRICCDSAGDSDLPVALRRYQFTVRHAWAMTINKSQGQTFHDRTGIYLPRPCFSHGQLYVALSRSSSAAAVRILAELWGAEQGYVVKRDGTRMLRTLNIVDREYLHLGLGVSNDLEVSLGDEHAGSQGAALSQAPHTSRAAEHTDKQSCDTQRQHHCDSTEWELMEASAAGAELDTNPIQIQTDASVYDPEDNACAILESFSPVETRPEPSQVFGLPEIVEDEQ